MNHSARIHPALDVLDAAGLAQRRAAAALVAFVATLGVLLFAVETLAQVGVTQTILVWLVTAFALIVPAAAALLAPTVSRVEFAVAGRGISAAANASAAAVSLFGGVFAVGLAAAFFRSETEASALALGLCGGALVGNVLLAPFVRRSAAASPGDFLAVRFGGLAAPALAGLAATAALAPMLLAELQLAAMVGDWTLGIGRETAMLVAAILMLVPPLIGGMRAVVLAAVLQFALLLTALVLASIWVSSDATGYVLPLAGYIEAAAKLQAVTSEAAKAPWQAAGLALSVALGVSCAPAMLMRAAAAGSPQAARSSLAWAMFFVALFAMAGISMAAIARSTVDEIAGQAGSASALVESHPWTVDWSGRTGTPVRLCDLPITSPDDVARPCGDPLKLGDLAVDPDVALLAAPDIAGVPALFAMLVAAGSLAASIAAGSLTLLGIGRAFAHDFLSRLAIRPLPISLQLLIERLTLIAATALAFRVAANPPADYLKLALVSLSLSASALFPALLAAVWWRRANRFGAAAAILVGFALALYPVAGEFYDPAIFTWFGLSSFSDLVKDLGSQRAPLLAVPIGLLVLVLASLITPRPGARQREVADALLSPRDLPADDD
jgi:cation/acetate symporter